MGTLHEEPCTLITLNSSYNEKCLTKKKSCRENHNTHCVVLLTVHISIFISVFNQLDAQNFVSQ